MGSSGGGSQTTQTVQKADPWAGQQPYLQDVFGQAQSQYRTPGPEFYPGATVAPIDPMTQYAQDYTAQAAQTTLPAIGQAAGANAMFNLGPARDVQTNPYLQSAIQAAFRPTIQAFTDPGGALSQARTQFQDAGQFGSSRHGLAEGILYSRLGDTLAGTAATMANRGYETGLETGVKQQALLPQTQQGLLMPATAAEAVGQQREAYAQSLLDEAIARYNYEQNLPALKLAQYQNLIQGNFGGEGISTSTAPAPSRNRALGALGGAASGAALGSAFPIIGTGIGALLGAVAGGFL